MKRRFLVKVGDKTFPVEVEEVEEETAQTPATPAIAVEARPVHAEVAPRPNVIVEAAAGAIRAPLPGKVISIKCSVGDSVKAGDTVLVLESMKMENVIMAPTSGRVKEIPVAEGANVALDDVLLVIE
ncbi:MAG: biotin/lipoyl-containing protein [Candidatus Bathyarchaeia archaeon]